MRKKQAFSLAAILLIPLLLSCLTATSVPNELTAPQPGGLEDLPSASETGEMEGSPAATTPDATPDTKNPARECPASDLEYLIYTPDNPVSAEKFILENLRKLEEQDACNLPLAEGWALRYDIRNGIREGWEYVVHLTGASTVRYPVFSAHPRWINYSLSHGV